MARCRKRSCNIKGPDFVALRAEARRRLRTRADAEDVPAIPEKQIGCGLTEEAAAGYDNLGQTQGKLRLKRIFIFERLALFLALRRAFG